MFVELLSCILWFIQMQRISWKKSTHIAWDYCPSNNPDMTSNLQNIFLKAERPMVTNCHIPCLGTLNYFGTCHCRKYLTTAKLQWYRHDTIHSDYIARHTGRSSHNFIPRAMELRRTETIRSGS